jgi:SAM-dependent methyltransferase
VFLTITTTRSVAGPATDLGFLLHKHPDKAQSFATSYGTAHVFYPEASEQSCTAALLLEVDPVALLRRGRGKGRGGAPDSALAQYVNDRPYAASSLLAVALSTVFSSAMKGVCRPLPERAATAMPLRIEVPALSARGGADLVRAMFEPLGWTVTATPVALDEKFPEWGESRYVAVTLEGEQRLSDALRHLYVLLPVLDAAKHYWVSADEVDKLLRAGEGWLAGHPERKLITTRYLSRRWSLTREATERLELARLAESDDSPTEEIDNAVADPAADDLPPDDDAMADSTVPGSDVADGTVLDRTVADDTPIGDRIVAGDRTTADDSATGGTAVADDAVERPVSLATARRVAILAALRAAGATRVLDLGCGEGLLIRALLADPRVTEVLGVDVSVHALTVAARRLGLKRMSERQAARVELTQGALTYTDDRLKGYDAAVLSEVVEHLDPPRLPALEYAVFGAARPGTVVVTTPNAEYNVRWETLPVGQVRHHDHRFEWTRAEFRGWAGSVAERYGYAVEFIPVGDDDPELGPPTQMAVFGPRAAEPVRPTDPDADATSPQAEATRPRADATPPPAGAAQPRKEAA